MLAQISRLNLGQFLLDNYELSQQKGTHVYSEASGQRSLDHHLGHPLTSTSEIPRLAPPSEPMACTVHGPLPHHPKASSTRSLVI